MGIIIPVFIPHAGCPHQCSFCNQKKISGQHSANIKNAKVQITKYLEWTKPSKNNQIAYYGGSFTGLDVNTQKEFLELAESYVKTGVIGSIRMSTRPDYINNEILDLLGKYTVDCVELGVQSLDEKVLLATERGHSKEDVFKAVKLLKLRGFKVGTQLMVGMPEQTWQNIYETVQYILKLKPDVARIYPLLVVKGAPLEKTYEKGEFQPISLAKAIAQSDYVYQKLSKAGIKVIRLGLQADDELCADGNIIDGPFHPAFGELVKSFPYRFEINNQFTKLNASNFKITINYKSKNASKIRGMKKENLLSWENNFKINFELKEYSKKCFALETFHI